MPNKPNTRIMRKIFDQQQNHRETPKEHAGVGQDKVAASRDRGGFRQPARGRLGGRPQRLSRKQIEQLRTLAADKRNSVTDICRTMGIGRTTFYRYIKTARE
jgi:DNA invertase Pin-like site-specific DNA recombinase